jgi:hypothetical protein
MHVTLILIPVNPEARQFCMYSFMTLLQAALLLVGGKKIASELKPNIDLQLALKSKLTYTVFYDLPLSEYRRHNYDNTVSSLRLSRPRSTAAVNTLHTRSLLANYYCFWATCLQEIKGTVSLPRARECGPQAANFQQNVNTYHQPPVSEAAISPLVRRQPSVLIGPSASAYATAV